MGKWTHLKNKLQPVEPTYESPEYAQKVAAWKEHYGTKSKQGLAEVFHEKRKTKEAIEKSLSQVSAELEALSELLVNEMEDTGESSFRDASTGYLFYIQDEPQCRVMDPDANRQWAMRNGLESELKLNWQKLNAITKERLEAGKPAPEGVEVRMRTSVRMRKA